MPNLPDRQKHEHELEVAIWLILQKEYRVLVRDPTQANWAAWREETAKALQEPLAQTYSAAMRRMEKQKKTGLSDGEIDELAAAWATVYALQLASLITGTSHAHYQDAIARAARDEISRAEALQGAFSRGRAESLGVTEVTRITTEAEKAVQQRAYTIEIERALADGDTPQIDVPFWQVHPERSKTGPCDICQPLHNRPEWEWPLEFAGGPGAHPGCVCDLVWRTMPADMVPAGAASYAA